MTEFTRPILRQCPLTCGLPTRMTEYGFSKACAARLERIKKLAEVSSTDPHAAYCRECKGENRPVELEIISMEEMIMAAPAKTFTAVKEYTMPASLAAVLKPISQAEAETISLKELMKFWRRPLIKLDQASECPCCGNVRTLKCRGICGGCNNTKVAKLNLTGHALLEHLAMRASGGQQNDTGTTNKESTSSATVPSSPAAPPAVAGQVECNDQQLADLEGVAVAVAIRMAMGLDSTTPLRDLPQHIERLIVQRDSLIEQRDTFQDAYNEVEQILCVGVDENLSKVAARIKAEADRSIVLLAKIEDLTEEVVSLNRLLATQPVNFPAATEEAIVAKWSSLPVPDGYETLASVLQDAIDQAANGKGRDRHADEHPFDSQPILRETMAVGLGFPAGQARKKILEAVRCSQDHPERAIADLLGAINYTAALVIAIRNSQVDQAA